MIIKTDQKRHILKTISYRIIQFFVTASIGWILTGNYEFGLGLGLLETIIKSFVYYFHERVWFKYIRFKKKIIKSENLYPKKLGISRNEREKLLKQNSQVIWLTGLSGSGKTTIAEELEKKLLKNGYKTFILDGDNTRFGINADLGFKKWDREENIRRVAEISKLFNDAGYIVLTAFISPYEYSRENARNIIGKNNFKEIYVATSLENCIRRDKKGLYKKAINGKIKNFTGISDPYDIPKNPFLRIDAGKDGSKYLKDNINKIYNSIEPYIKKET